MVNPKPTPCCHLTLAPTLEAVPAGGATGREEDTSCGAPFLSGTNMSEQKHFATKNGLRSD